MSKSKQQQKGRKSVVPDVAPLDAGTRQVTLSLILERASDLGSAPWDSLTETLTVVTRFCGVEHTAHLSDLTVQSGSAGSAVAGSAVSEGDCTDCVISIPLATHRVNVKDAGELTSLVNGVGGKPHHVELYAAARQTVVIATEGEATASTGGALSSSPQTKKKAQKPKAAKKGLTSSHEPVLIAAEDRVASAWLNGCDLLTQCVVRTPMAIGDEKRVPGVVGCWLQLSTGTAPLVESAESLRWLRPVVFTVHSLENVPRVLETAHPATSNPDTTLVDAHATAATATTAESSLPPLQLRVAWGPHQFCIPVQTRPSPAPAVGGELDESFCRSVCFLCDVEPFDAYRRAFHESVNVTLIYTDASHNQLPMGSGCFPVRDLVTDDQTFFSEAVQLLPERASFTTTESCLTAGTTANVSVDFALPLPPVVHVTDAGVECAAHHFLTRAVLVVPYDAPWIEKALRALISRMKRFPRATADVHPYTEPSVDARDVDGGAPSSLTEAVPTAAVGKDKTERSSRRGRQSRSSSPPPPVEAPSPYLLPSLKVVSPGGVSGFEVADGALRVFCFEGTVPELHHILEGVASAAQHDPEMKILLNSELFVPHRLFLSFPPLVTPPECFTAKKAAEPPSSPTSPTDSAANAPKTSGRHEIAEAGGTGGRIHRVRVGQSLDQLVSQQQYLLKRTLSSSCLTAIQRLSQLTRCGSLAEAMNRSFFPSATDIISLERSFGRTLDVFDLFGRDEYDVAAAVACDASLVMTAGGVTTSGATASPPHGHADDRRGDFPDDSTVDLGVLRHKDVGRLTSFTGTLLLDRARRIPSAVAQRFHAAQWMTTEDGIEVLCVFPRRAPTGTIRYHVEGQVVACGDDFLLYVLDYQTLAKSWTDTHNPSYEAFLKSRAQTEKRAVAFGVRNLRFSPTSGTRATTQTANASTHHISSVTRRGKNASATTVSSDDDDDAFSPPLVDDYRPSQHANLTSVGGSRERADLSDRRLTRAARLRAKVSSGAAQATVSDDTLWQLYEKRAPKGQAAAPSTVADSVPHEVMRF